MSRALILEVESIGCKSCIAPTKIYFFKVKGVKGVHIIGKKVVVIYDENMVTYKDLLKLSGVMDYYKIKVLSDRELDKNEIESLMKTKQYKYLWYNLSRSS